MSDTPVYDALCAEVCDPEVVSREADEWLIRWHLTQQGSSGGRDDGG